MLDTNKSPKSFWKRSEGITGAVVIIGLIVVGLLFWSTIATFVVSALSSLLSAILLFVGIGIILYILLDPKVRALVWYMYKSVMRWITGIFVQINPIAILESYIDYLYKNLKEMNGHIAKLKGQIVKLKGIMQKNKDEMKTSLLMAEQAKKKGNMELVTINTRQFGRLQEANKRYGILLTRINLLHKILGKIHKNSGYLIKDIENEVRMRKQEAAAIKAGHSAMKRAMNIINGDPDRKMIFDMAMESIVEDVSNKIGEMERFIQVSGSFIDSVDLQNGIYEQEGLMKLEEMAEKGVSFLLNDTPSDLYTENSNDKDVEKDNDLGNISAYNDLFN